MAGKVEMCLDLHTQVRSRQQIMYKSSKNINDTCITHGKSLSIRAIASQSSSSRLSRFETDCSSLKSIPIASERNTKHCMTLKHMSDLHEIPTAQSRFIESFPILNQCGIKFTACPSKSNTYLFISTLVNYFNYSNKNLKKLKD